MKLIDCSAFYKTALTEVTIPESVENVGEEAFYDCQALTTVTFEEGSSLKSIGKWAFFGTSITRQDMPNLI